MNVANVVDSTNVASSCRVQREFIRSEYLKSWTSHLLSRFCLSLLQEVTSGGTYTQLLYHQLIRASQSNRFNVSVLRSDFQISTFIDFKIQLSDFRYRQDRTQLLRSGAAALISGLLLVCECQMMHGYKIWNKIMSYQELEHLEMIILLSHLFV